MPPCYALRREPDFNPLFRPRGRFVPTLSRRLILAAALVAAALPAAAAPGVAAPDDMSLGKPTAPIKIVEYASMSCPHCAHFHETIFPVIKAKYIDTGRAQ